MPMLINAAAFYGDRNIKVGHSIFHAFFKKYILYSISPFRSNIAENIFLNGFLLSGNKSYDGLVFLRKTFK